jgi:hypothetical protein
MTYTILCAAGFILCAFIVFVAWACCVVAGRADDIAEQRDGIRRS